MANPHPKGISESAPDGIGAFIRAIIHEEVGAALDEKLPHLVAALRLPPRSAEPVESVYVSRKEAAEIMDYSLRTVGRMIASGELIASGPRQDRIKRFEIDRMMAKRRKPNGVATEEDEVNGIVDRLMKEDE